MNKTVTINISGIVFHIEEDAFDRLSKYLETIKSYFKDSDGRDEIMADIESRIAELLKERVGTFREVVVPTDVDHVISIMGKPEDYATESGEETGAKPEPEQVIDFSKRRRRVFRDTDNKVLAGVCSGVSNYFDMDPIWLRLSLVFFTIFGGAGVLVYIVLWIVIPEAKTTAEKLEMKGEKVNINNIKKSVEEELEHLKKKGKEMEEDLKNFTGPENRQKVKSGVDKFLDFVASVATSFLTVFGKIFAVALIILGVIFTVGLFTSVFGLSNFGWSNGTLWLETVFNSAGEYELAMIALLLILGIPFIMLIYGGFRLLLGIKERNRLVSIVALLLWVIGLGIGIYSGVELGSQFREIGRVKEIQTINTGSDTLYLKGIPAPPEEMEDEEDFTHYREHNGNRSWEYLTINEQKIRFGYPDVTIEKAEGDSFYVEVIRMSRGYDKKEALNLARGIQYQTPTITDSLVEIYSTAEFKRENKLRAQDVKVVIHVPVGKSVYLSSTLKHLIYDIPNVHDIWDGDMTNRVWTMTADGLDCGKCEGLDVNGEHVRVGNGEVHIKNEKEEIHIKDGTIRIKENSVPEKKSESENKPDKVDGVKTSQLTWPGELLPIKVGIPFVGLGWGL